MFRRVLALIIGLAHSLTPGLTPDGVRAALVAILQRLITDQTPLVERLLLQMAVAFIQSSAWDLILARLIGLGVAIDVRKISLTARGDDELDDDLEAAFAALPLVG